VDFAATGNHSAANAHKQTQLGLPGSPGQYPPDTVYRKANEVTMIRFACPTCKKVLQAESQQAGQKVACPGCGQRLQIPAPPRNKTVLGSLVAENEAAAQLAASPVEGAGSKPASEPAGDLIWFYVHDGRRNGPVSFAQLQQLAASSLDRKALVWQAGTPNWVTANTVSGLTFKPRGGKGRKVLAWGSLGLATAACGLVAVWLGLRDITSAQAGSKTPSGNSTAEQGQTKTKDDKRNNKPKNEKPKNEKPKNEKPKNEKPRQNQPSKADLEARALAAELAGVGKEFAGHLEHSAKVLQEAVKADQDPSEALFQFRMQVARPLQDLAASLKKLNSTLDNIVFKMPNGGGELRDTLTGLYGKCHEMQQMLEGKGLEHFTPESYAEKVNSLVRELKELSRKV
jgi:DNA-directed RNA polymerase subunit RPC12/RpoP